MLTTSLVLNNRALIYINISVNTVYFAIFWYIQVFGNLVYSVSFSNQFGSDQGILDVIKYVLLIQSKKIQNNSHQLFSLTLPRNEKSK